MAIPFYPVRWSATFRRSARLWAATPAYLIALVLGLLLAIIPLPVAAILFAGACLLLLIFLQPLVGVGFMLLLAPFGALENVIWGNTLFDSGQVLFLLTVAAWLALSVRRRRIVLPTTTLNVPLALFILVASVTLLGAASLNYGLREVIKWLEVALVMLIAVDLVRRQRASSESSPLLLALPASAGSCLLAGLVLLSGLSQALIGIWQFALRGTGPEHFQILGGAFYRAYGTFEQPNPFGGFMAWITLLGLGGAVGVLMAWWERRRPFSTEWPWLLFTLAAGGAAGLALLASWSRGAWLGFGAGLATVLFFWPRRRRWGLLALFAGAALLLALWQFNLLPSALVSRTVGFAADLRLGDVRGADINDANYAVQERLAHWQAAVDMGRDHLWLGVGFGNYEPAYDDYALINWPYALGHAHNYYLNLLAETGILGLAAYLVFWGAVLFQTVGTLRRLPWPDRGLALGLLGAWIALSVHHVLDKLYVNNLYLHLGVMLAILHTLQRSDVQKV
ncbi:MAG TPA: O-antigen ligase family protein [Candidatus Sulfomarinibacteraceae bacterium]|nr:O-antigen ligase family protein [Candidatus Sulfomarinibacteraceae bacterium]